MFLQDINDSYGYERRKGRCRAEMEIFLDLIERVNYLEKENRRIRSFCKKRSE
jgi:hypothetical protein